MRKLFFCNIGWMSRYEGQNGKPDRIVGGGAFVSEHDWGQEVCNFLPADDGQVYGHVETSHGEIDRAIRLENLGGGKGDEALSGVDVVWTATHPDEGGRRVVGWYRDATVYRHRQVFERLPSKQYKKDNIENYRITALAENVFRLGVDDRSISMPKDVGFMGHTPWWTPKEDSADDVRAFIAEVEALLQRFSPEWSAEDSDNDCDPDTGRGSSSAATDPYIRYMRKLEVEVAPRHKKLQDSFVQYLKGAGAKNIKEDQNWVDLRFTDEKIGLVLVEVKPCNETEVRYAIRMAMGQLLDYRQKTDSCKAMMIALEKTPSDFDRDLALSNGFGLAYPAGSGFEMKWPE